MMDHDGTENEADVEEVEHFDDFTLASSWERFISEIEAVCRRWLADGPKNLLEKGAVSVGTSKHLYKARSELKYDKKSYYMEYYFKEKHKTFVPVHDPSRKAHIGIQNMGTAFTRRFESDCIRSQVPVKLMHLEGLYELFVCKFAYSTLDVSMHLFRVQFTMKLTYRTLPYDEDGDPMPATEDENTESSAAVRADRHHRTRWDDDCPWIECYSADDPVKGFELITVWSERTIKSSLEMAEIENSTPHEADTWLLLPILEILNGNHKAKAVGFASQLSLLVDALEKSSEAQFLEDFVSGESNAENLRSSASVPPPTVVDCVLKELFHEGNSFHSCMIQ